MTKASNEWIFISVLNMGKWKIIIIIKEKLWWITLHMSITMKLSINFECNIE